MGLEIVCLTSACYLYDKTNAGRYLEEGKAYIDTASALGASYIRVLGDKDPQPSADIDDSVVAASLEPLGQYAKERGVVPLIETNGVYADTNGFLRFCEAFPAAASESFGICTIHIGILESSRSKLMKTSAAI